MILKTEGFFNWSKKKKTLEKHVFVAWWKLLLLFSTSHFQTLFYPEYWKKTPIKKYLGFNVWRLKSHINMSKHKTCSWYLLKPSTQLAGYCPWTLVAPLLPWPSTLSLVLPSAFGLPPAFSGCCYHPGLLHLSHPLTCDTFPASLCQAGWLSPVCQSEVVNEIGQAFWTAFLYRWGGRRWRWGRRRGRGCLQGVCTVATAKRSPEERIQVSHVIDIVGLQWY